MQNLRTGVSVEIFSDLPLFSPSHEKKIEEGGKEAKTKGGEPGIHQTFVCL